MRVGGASGELLLKSKGGGKDGQHSARKIKRIVVGSGITRIMAN